MLQSHGVQCVADVRHFPGSRKFPHFNTDALSHSLAADGIGYRHFIDLGGRRKPLPDSANTAWRHEAFRGYADYMQTWAFRRAILDLEQLAERQMVAYMCSEAVWWRCHRAMISDYLKSRGWQVLHIMGASTAREHPYTAPARIEYGVLTYAPGH